MIDYSKLITNKLLEDSLQGSEKILFQKVLKSFKEARAESEIIGNHFVEHANPENKFDSEGLEHISGIDSVGKKQGYVLNNKPQLFIFEWYKLDSKGIEHKMIDSVTLSAPKLKRAAASLIYRQKVFNKKAQDSGFKKMKFYSPLLDVIYSLEKSAEKYGNLNWENYMVERYQKGYTSKLYFAVDWFLEHDIRNLRAEYSDNPNFATYNTFIITYKKIEALVTDSELFTEKELFLKTSTINRYYLYFRNIKHPEYNSIISSDTLGEEISIKSPK